MKKLNTLLVLILACLTLNLSAQERYVDEVFSSVTKAGPVVYGVNTTVLTVPVTGNVTKQPLVMETYTPDGDTETSRPLVIMLHTGNFLPITVNGSVSGTVADSPVVEIATRLAKMGYVVASADYRQGWNPVSTVQEVRVNTLINASYRGIQDVRTCIRFFKKSVAENGNPYGIDTSKVVVWGIGTGGYVSLGAATIDNYNELVIPKFIGSDVTGDGVPDPMVIQPINGDPSATMLGINPSNGDTLCFPNHLGYTSDFALQVNMGGALGDTSWMDASDPPMISYQVPTDPFAPYDEDILIVPTTGDLIVEVQGANLFQEKAQSLGLNQIFDDAFIADEYTTAADSRNGGKNGLFPMPRPNWPDPNNPGQTANLESSPWDYWDANFWSMSQPDDCANANLPLTQCNWHLVSLGSNPDMSTAKAHLYIDSIMGYYAPRACAALDLPCSTVSTNQVAKNVVDVKTVPNPATTFVNLITGSENMEAVSLFDVNGRMIQNHNNVNANNFTLDRAGAPAGFYIVRIQFENSITTKKVIFK